MAEHPINVSSLVVKTSPEHHADVLAALEASGLCEVHFHDGSGKIIVTIEGQNTGDEMRKMKEIQGLPHVLAADLAYSYCEDEFEKAGRDFVESSGSVPERLRKC